MNAMLMKKSMHGMETLFRMLRKMRLKKADHRTAGRSRRSFAKRFSVPGVIAAVLFLAAGSEVHAQYQNIRFPRVSYANATAPGGYTVTNAVNYNGNKWTVNVQAPTWTSTYHKIDQYNPGGWHHPGPDSGPDFTHTYGIYFGAVPGTGDENYSGPYLFTFTFTRTAGTDPLELVVHSGERVANETDTLTTTGDDWFDSNSGNLSKIPVINRKTAVFEDVALISDLGWWDVRTTLNATVGNSDTITYSYVSHSQRSSNMIVFQVIPPVDYGDVPELWEDISSIARHTINTELGVYLGSAPPDDDDFPEKGPPSSDDAMGDDNDTGGDDEDGVTFTYDNKEITATVTVVNDTDHTAYMCCWLDGGVLSATDTVVVNDHFSDGTTTTPKEKRCVDGGLPPNSGSTTHTLSWHFPVTSTTTTYARCRVYARTPGSGRGVGILSFHYYPNGEVEDYKVTVNPTSATVGAFTVGMDSVEEFLAQLSARGDLQALLERYDPALSETLSAGPISARYKRP